MGIELPGDEIGIGENTFVQRNRGLDAFDHEAVERAIHPRDGFGAVAAVSDEFGDQRIVIGRDDGVGVAAVSTRIPGPPGTRNAVMRPGDGTNVSGSSALMRHSIAWPRNSTIRRRHRSFSPGGDANLRLDQIHARDHFRDRMLDLNARVHLDEVEIAGFFAQKLNRAGARIADFLQRLDDLRADALPGRCVERGRRRFLEKFLMAALERAFAFAEMDHVAVIDRPALETRCGAAAR